MTIGSLSFTIASSREIGTLPFTVTGLHESGEILKLPLRKGGVDQSGLYDYSYSVLKNSPPTPHVLTLSGDASVHADGYLELGGTNGYVSIPDSSEFDLVGEFTIESWVYINSNSVYVFGGNPVSSQNPVTKPTYGFYLTPTSMWFGYTTGFATWPLDKNVATSISTGVWHHVAVTRNASNDIYFWLDGSQVGGSSNYSGTMSNALSYIGVGGVLNGSGIYSDGRMVDFRYSKVCRYTGTFVPESRGSMILPQDLFQYNPHEVLNFPLTGHIIDLSYGLMKGAPATAHVISVSGNANVINGYLAMDGSGDYVKCVDISSDCNFSNSEWSISFDARITTTNYTGPFLSMTGTNTVLGVEMTSPSEGLRFVVYSNLSGNVKVCDIRQGSSSGWSGAVWYNVQVVCVNDGGVRTVYLKRDGVTLASAVISTSMPSFHTVALGTYIGQAGSPSDYFDGDLRSVKVFNGTSAAPAANYSYAMGDIVVKQNAVTRSIMYAERELSPITGTGTVMILDPVHAATDVSFSSSGFSMALSEPTFSPAPLHDAGEVLRLPLVKSGVDQYGLFDYSYSSAKANPSVPMAWLNQGLLIDAAGMHGNGIWYAYSTGASEANLGTSDFCIHIDALTGPASLAAQQCLFSKFSTAGAEDGIGTAMDTSGRLFIETSDGGARSYRRGTTDFRSATHSVDFIRSGGTIKIYVDGVEETYTLNLNQSTVRDISNSENMRLFYDEAGGGYIGTYFQGVMKGFTILKGVTTSPTAIFLPQNIFWYNPYEVLNLPLTGHTTDMGYGLTKVDPVTAHTPSVNSGTIGPNGLAISGGNYLAYPHSGDFMNGVSDFYKRVEITFNALPASSGGGAGVGQYMPIFDKGGNDQTFALLNNYYGESGVKFRMRDVSNNTIIELQQTGAFDYSIGISYTFEIMRNGASATLKRNGVQIASYTITNSNAHADANDAMRFGYNYDAGGGMVDLAATIHSVLLLKGTSVAPDANYAYAMSELAIEQNNVARSISYANRALNPVSGACTVTVYDPVHADFYAAVTGGDFLIGGWEVLNVLPVPLRGTIPSTNASDTFAVDQLHKWAFYNWPRSTYTVSGGKLQIRVDGVGDSYSQIDRYFKTNTGDFYVTIDWTLNSLGGSSGLVYVPYFAATFDNGHICVMYKSGNQLAWATYIPGYTAGTVSYTDTSGIWRFRRTSGTVYIEYWNGSSWTSIRSFSESSGVSYVYITPYVNGTVNSQLSLDINDFSTDLELMPGFNGIYNPHEVLNMPLTGHVTDLGYGLRKASPQVAHIATSYNSPTTDANGLSLNGSNQYLTVPYSADFNLGLYFSVEFEFKVNSLAASENYIFTVNDDNGGWAAAEFEVQSNGVLWAGSYIGSIRWVYTSAGTITTGIWYKVRLVRAADTLRAYLNDVEFGTPISGLGTTPTNNWSGPTYIGRRGYSGTPWYFNGSIRSILVLNGTSTPPATNYRYALQDFRIEKSNEEVPYTAPLRGLNPVTGQFDVWIKEPLNGFFSRHGALTVYGNSNVSSGYLTLDGAGDYGSVPYNADFALGSGDFTLEAWLRPTVDMEMYASGIYDGASAHTLRLFVYDRTGARRFAAFFRTTSGSVTLWDSTAITVSAWTHVAAVRNGSSFKLYVNGVERASAVDGTAIASVTGNLYIGAMNTTGTPSGLWTGGIADYRLVKGVALYTGTFTPPPRGTLTPVTNTVLFYPFSSNLLDYALQDGQTRPSSTALKFYVGNQAASAPTQAVTWPAEWKRLFYRSGFGTDLIGGVPLTLVGTPTITDGLNTNASGSYGRIPVSSDLNFGSNELTLILLLNASGDVTNKYLLLDGNDNMVGETIGIMNIGGNAHLYANGSNVGSFGAYSSVVLHTAALTVGDSRVTRFYKDATQIGGTLNSPSSLNNNTVTFGVGARGGDGGNAVTATIYCALIVNGYGFSPDDLFLIDGALRTPETFIELGTLQPT